jgi:hypothetical protein
MRQSREAANALIPKFWRGTRQEDEAHSHHLAFPLLKLSHHEIDVSHVFLLYFQTRLTFDLPSLVYYVPAHFALR